MVQDSKHERSEEAADFVGRPPPTDGETVWIDDDYVFDLMLALCDLLYDDGCRSTSYLMERSLDLFLYEIGRTPSPRWLMDGSASDTPSGKSRDSNNGRSPGTFRSRRALQCKDVDSPLRDPMPSFETDISGRAVTGLVADCGSLQPPHTDSLPDFEGSKGFGEAGNDTRLLDAQVSIEGGKDFFPFSQGCYSVTVFGSNQKVVALNRTLRKVLRRRRQY